MQRGYLIFICFCLIFTSCQKNSKKNQEPELSLLNYFLSERSLLKSYEKGSYLDYITIQVGDFPRKQRQLTPLITAINTKYEKMKEHEQIDYQEKWRRKFQPVVDEIGELTRKITSSQTAILTPETMAEIEKLILRQQILEKEYPAPKLLPTFFDNPDQ